MITSETLSSEKDSLALDPSKPLPDEIRRLAHELIEAAEGHLESLHEAPDEGVHQTRKRLKELRALFRIIREPLGEQIYHIENIRMRDAGRLLAHARDTTVLLGLFEEHFPRLRKGHPVNVLTAIRERLRDEHEEAVTSLLKGDAILKARMALERTKKQISSWPLHNKGFSLLEGGMERVYRRGVKRLQEARLDPTDEHLHEWRKRVKYLWYHIRMIAPAWPPVLENLAEELHRLSDLLGDDHDLAVLAERLKSFASDKSGFQHKKLVRYIGRQQHAIRPESWVLGARIYAEEPEHFSSRMGTYWTAALLEQRIS